MVNLLRGRVETPSCRGLGIAPPRPVGHSNPLGATLNEWLFPNHASRVSVGQGLGYAGWYLSGRAGGGYSGEVFPINHRPCLRVIPVGDGAVGKEYVPT